MANPILRSTGFASALLLFASGCEAAPALLEEPAAKAQGTAESKPAAPAPKASASGQDAAAAAKAPDPWDRKVFFGE